LELLNWSLSGRWNWANALPSLPKGGGTALAVGGYLHKLITVENTVFEHFLYPTTKQGLVPLPLGKGGSRSGANFVFKLPDKPQFFGEKLHSILLVTALSKY